MDKAQRTLLLVMPIAFVFFIARFPVGLVLYWMTTNLWVVGQGLVTRRLIPRTAAPEKRTSRTPAKAEPVPVPAAASAEVERPKQPAQPRRVKRKKRSGRR